MPKTTKGINVLDNLKPTMHCIVCDTTIKRENIGDHLRTKKHQQNLAEHEEKNGTITNVWDDSIYQPGDPEYKAPVKTPDEITTEINESLDRTFESIANEIKEVIVDTPQTVIEENENKDIVGENIPVENEKTITEIFDGKIVEDCGKDVNIIDVPNPDDQVKKAVEEITNGVIVNKEDTKSYELEGDVNLIMMIIKDENENTKDLIKSVLIPLQGSVKFSVESKKGYIKVIKDGKPRFYITLGKKPRIEVSNRNEKTLFDTYKDIVKDIIDDEVGGIRVVITSEKARKIGIALRETFPKNEGETFLD